MNLISVSALVKRNTMSLNFTPHACVIQDIHTLKMIGKGDLVGGLYVLKAETDMLVSTIVKSAHHAMVANVVNKTTWHKRLGHLSFKRMELIKDQLHFHDANNDICSVCPLAKQRRLSFVSNNQLSKCAFDLIHCDTWGRITHLLVMDMHIFSH